MAWIIIEIVILLFGCWTFFYHLTLALDIPVFFTVIFTLISLLSLTITYFNKSIQCTLNKEKTHTGITFPLVILAILPGFLNIFILNPNPDDAQFFHRAFSQIGSFNSPFYKTDTLLNLHDIPALSKSHLISSYEPFVAVISSITLISPLFIIHNIVPFLVGIIYTYTIFYLYREFNLSEKQAQFATLIQYIFLFSDIQLAGGPSYGNMILNLWNGKVILWSLAPPLVILYIKKLFNNFNSKDYTILFSLSLCAIGLTGSGIPFFPAIVFLSIASTIFTNKKIVGHKTPDIKATRIALISSTAIYPIILGLCIYAKLIPMPQNTNVWIDGWPLKWNENLKILINDKLELIRNILLVIAIPLIFLGSNFFICYLFFFIIFFANPITGPFLIEILQPGSYWRLLFTLPVAFCSGFLVLSFKNGRHSTPFFLSAITISFVILVFLHQGPTLEKIHATTIKFKSPLANKIDYKNSNFILRNKNLLDGANILAPDELALTIALNVPNAKFDSIRGFEHLLNNSEHRNQINSRKEAQYFVSNCDSPENEDSIIFDAINRGVNLIVINNCKKFIPRYFVKNNIHHEKSTDENYIVFNIKN